MKTITWIPLITSAMSLLVIACGGNDDDRAPAPTSHAEQAESVDANLRSNVPGLHAPAVVVRDTDGVPHIKASNVHDLFFLQGYVHANDRLFQMDVTRRRVAGTLAELLGSSALPSDVQMRAIGIRRSAERSLPAHSRETQDALRAYAQGVNAWIARNKLPGQYAAVQVSKVEPWTPVDSVSVVKALAFTLSFDLDIDRTSAVRAFDAAGIDGQTAVFQDLMPFAPFDKASPVIDATSPPSSSLPAPLLTRGPAPRGARGVSKAVERMAADVLARAEQAPLIAQALNRTGDRGSNSWVIGGRHTVNGRPILASDPHLSLESPTVFHPVHLEGGDFHTQGDSIPGAPYVILGQNRQIAFGATQHFMDVTDTFVEQVRPDPASPSGLSTVYQGRLEPIVAIDETFRVNARAPGQQDVLTIVPAGGAIPAQTLIVPRRNNGPLLSFDKATGNALSVQYTGFSATTELDAFRRIDLARNVDDFRQALQFFDVGALHFVYADIEGNIAYFTNAEVPVREDLQAGAVRGNPPYLLRDGTGGNEWLPVRNPQPQQSLPYEIVPFSEMPQTVNPPAGFIVSANNDPTANTFDNNVLNQTRPAGGIFYLSFFHNGFRAGRITDMIRAAVRKGKVSADDVTAMQADTTGIDAQFFTPLISAALERARRSATPELAALAKDERIVEAVGRLSRWNHSYPTGIAEGHDAADRNGTLGEPSRQEIDHSVAATIYALWRGRFVVNVLDKHVQQISPQLPSADDFFTMQALKQLIVDFDSRQGVGRSGIDFFAVPGIGDANDRRDVLMLTSLRDALTLAASDNFKTAFGNSTNQSDYRWGKLHRLTLPSPLGAPYTIPSQGNRFTSPLPGLPGIPFDGGFNVPDVAGHPVRADAPDKFTISLVPVRRFVAEATRSGWRSRNSLNGGAREGLGDKFEQNLLRRWLTNDTYPVRMDVHDLLGAIDSVTLFLPTLPR
jgi:penicillin G amidase